MFKFPSPPIESSDLVRDVVVAESNSIPNSTDSPHEVAPTKPNKTASPTVIVEVPETNQGNMPQKKAAAISFEPYIDKIIADRVEILAKRKQEEKEDEEVKNWWQTCQSRQRGSKKLKMDKVSALTSSQRFHSRLKPKPAESIGAGLGDEFRKHFLGR